MTRIMIITVQCERCDAEIEVDLENGSPFDDDETKIEKALDEKGWYANMDGDYCPKHAERAKKLWLAGVA